MKRYCLFIILFGCRALPAQEKELDSLLAVLKSYPREDTVKLNLLNDIAFDYYNVDPSKGLEMADRAIALAQKLNNQAKLAGAYAGKGTNYWAKGDDSLALRMYGLSMAIHQQMHDSPGVGKILNNFALIYFGMSDYAKALEYHEKALEIFEQLHDSSRVAQLCNNIGVVYQFLSDYPRALDYYLRALRVYERNGDEANKANALSDIGIVYKSLSKFDTALRYHNEALRIYEQTGNRRGMANTYGNIGVVYDELDNYPKALEYYQKGLAINETVGNQRRLASDLTNIGVTYKNMKDYPKALAYLKKAMKAGERSGDKNTLSATLNELTQVYFKAPVSLLKQEGIAPADRYATALRYQNRSLQLARESGAPDRQSEAWENLSDLYEAEGNYKQALAAYKQHIVFRDSIYSQEKAKEITRKEMEFQFEKKEALLKSENAQQQVLAAAEIRRERVVKQSTMGGAALLLLAAVMGYFLYKRRRDAEEEKKEAEFKVQVADTEMKALRLQMNPHFIFNSLNSIGDYILRNDIQKADYYLSRFARVMRLILENSEQKEVPLCEDLKALDLYMQLEAMRLDHKFSYEIRVDDAIDQETTLVPPLLLQPFVENSIWHGISRKQGKGNILIEIRKEAQMLNCSIEDNGVGRTRETLSGQSTGGKKSFGMKITKSRIDILNRIKKTTAAVELRDLAEGMRVEVKLPLELSF